MRTFHIPPRWNKKALLALALVPGVGGCIGLSGHQHAATIFAIVMSVVAFVFILLSG